MYISSNKKFKKLIRNFSSVERKKFNWNFSIFRMWYFFSKKLEKYSPLKVYIVN